MNPKEAIELAKVYVRNVQRLDGMNFYFIPRRSKEGKAVCVLTSEPLDEDVYPIVKQTLGAMMLKGHWVNTLLRHIEHLEGENRDLWNELQKGKDDG